MASRARGMGAASISALRRPAVVGTAAVDSSLVTALAAEDPGQSFRTVRVAEVAEHPDNPRALLGDLDELAASIRTLGLRQPIVVVPAAEFPAADLSVEVIAVWLESAGSSVQHADLADERHLLAEERVDAINSIRRNPCTTRLGHDIDFGD